MKLLLLASIGQEGKEEQTRYVNLYFASLKKYVVPFFDTKAIVINTWKTSDATKKRIQEYGLEDVVDLREIHELGLPQESLDFLSKRGYYSKSPMRFNILYDYAKQNDFFGADWMFHTDTDLEFLPNFSEILNKIHDMKSLHPRIAVSLAGDNYQQSVRNNGKIYTFTPSPRVNFYDVSTLSETINDLVIHSEEMGPQDQRRNVTIPLYVPEQSKLRNDFFGMTREAAQTIALNWVHSQYPHGKSKLPPEVWPSNSELEIIHSPGDDAKFHMYSGLTDIMWFHLLEYTQMANHYYGGWHDEVGKSARNKMNKDGDFIRVAYSILSRDFLDTKHIWGHEYKEYE